MATQTKSVSGSTTTYTITDEAGNAMTVAVALPLGTAVKVTFAGAAVLPDAQQMLVTLMQLVSTGVIP